jgi:hypothetical protein
MPRYKPKTQVEIEAMTDQRLFNAHWWRASLNHNDKQTWATMENEVERRRKLIFDSPPRRRSGRTAP